MLRNCATLACPQDQAEAHAEAARAFIMVELATRQDLLALRQDMTVSTQTLRVAIDNLSLRMTMRMGVMLAAAVTLLGVVLRLHP
jgi:hypothetical protein